MESRRGAFEEAGSGEGREREACGALFLRYRALALRLASGLTPRADQAEDAVQEAGRALFERSRAGPPFESEAHARNYFLRAVQSRAVDLRREGHHGTRSLDAGPGLEPADSGPRHEDVEEDRARRESLRRAIAGLAAPEREVLEARYFEGLSFREIAARTESSISTLHSRVEAALERIRSRIGKEQGRP